MRLLTGADFWSLHPEPAVGLRRIVMSDGPAGVRGERWDERDPSANVPSPTALAATWDEARIERLGRLLAFECRRKGVDILLAPTVNLHRSPFGGRHFECFSEDPLLTARIGAAYVRGLQSEGVAATVKHFVANDSETERFTLDARVDERTLRELYMLPFELILEEEPWAVMAAYNAVNGHTMTESPMLRSRCCGRVGLRRARDVRLGRRPRTSGPATRRWISSCRGRTGRGATRWSRPCGRARERGGGGREGAAAAAAGERVSARGEAARPWSDEEIAAELRATAAAGIVLARNHGTLLPLGPLRKLAVLGPNAAVARTLGGGSATVFPPYTVSPLDGLRAALDAEVTYAPGVRTYTRLPVADVAPSCGISPPTAPSCRASGARSASSRGWGRSQDVAAIELNATVRAEQAGEYVIGCSGVGPPPALARRRGGVRRGARALARRRSRRGAVRAAAARRAGHAGRRPGGRRRAPPRGRRPRLRPGHAAAQRRSAVRRTTSSSGRSRWRARPTRRWSSWARPRRSRARASTARPWRCRAARTSSSAASRSPTRARSWSSTRARRC